ncbi:sulfurtransferase [Microbacterium pseudoresistens]|uniref:thiosulfate sulfurtransferase n=1 Tax=Microbacterium pseudoresistens TaxID=640634 RepID=A0A7Y9ET48_9MICO|nr:rhodanese-like domain-containing protein [Microbacterium pseudoresistens]NYD53472.1 thiosulfate/3-mercaptopyruvate sulfurtransferase [Microbacterium pseudoresistens]
MTENTIVDARRSLLIGADDPIPAGARFVEARFTAPERIWTTTVEGALRASLDNGVLAGPRSREHGVFPLPDSARLAATLADAEIEIDTPVVVYAATPEDAKAAARAWFVLRDAGVHDVRLLDGGADAWRVRQSAESARGENVATSESADTVGIAPVPRAIDATDTAEIGHTGVLLDARPASAHAKGHIPGAVSAPGEELFVDGRLRAASELEDWAGELGVSRDTPVGAYCGGGVAAAGTVFALATIGIEAPLYVGSWSQYSADPDNPVEA